jgi:hypothetical protein
MAGHWYVEYLSKNAADSLVSAFESQRRRLTMQSIKRAELKGHWIYKVCSCTASTKYDPFFINADLFCIFLALPLLALQDINGRAH